MSATRCPFCRCETCARLNGCPAGRPTAAHGEDFVTAPETPNSEAAHAFCVSEGMCHPAAGPHTDVCRKILALLVAQDRALIEVAVARLARGAAPRTI